MARLARVAACDDPLAVVCDIDGLTLTTGGDAPWVGQTEEYYYENDGVQSGDIADHYPVGRMRLIGIVANGGSVGRA